jgi:dihydroorotase
MVMRDIALARLTGTAVHFQHLSTRRSVALVAEAKAAGVAVTCEATPHHLTLTDERCAGYDPVFKVNPPLRTAADVAAVRAGLADGTVDCIATDHAPHAPETKEAPFDQAPPGMLGLETALALALTHLDLDPVRLVEVMSAAPARIIGEDRPEGPDGPGGHGGPIAAGRPAHLCVVDPAAEWTVDPVALASRSRNTPYAGMALTGRVRHTLLRGEPVVVAGEAQR